jgi:hypothetical protein
MDLQNLRGLEKDEVLCEANECLYILSCLLFYEDKHDIGGITLTEE